MRKRNGWFRLSPTDDEEFTICEDDLYNEKTDRIKQSKLDKNNRERNINNRRKKRESKRREEEVIRNQKERAYLARENAW